MPATLPDLPGSSADLSTRAVPNHPGRSSRCFPVASPLVAGFILVGRLATFVFLSRPNRVHLRYGSRVRLTSRTSPLLELPLARLHVEQAIYMVNSFQFTRSARLILASDRQGGSMGLRPTNTNEGVSGRCRGINNLDRAFNRAVLAVRVLAGLYKLSAKPWLSLVNRMTYRERLV